MPTKAAAYGEARSSPTASGFFSRKARHPKASCTGATSSALRTTRTDGCDSLRETEDGTRFYSIVAAAYRDDEHSIFVIVDAGGYGPEEEGGAGSPRLTTALRGLPDVWRAAGGGVQRPLSCGRSPQ